MLTLTFSNILVNLTHLNFEMVLVLVFSKIIIKPSRNGAFNHNSCKEIKALIIPLCSRGLDVETNICISSLLPLF